MLASLLPGLRDFRTPLATGYLYFLLAWVALGRDRVLPGAPNRFLARLFDLSTILGTSATIAAVSFTAYLLGSILVMREGPWIRAFVEVPGNLAHRIVKRSPRLRRYLGEKVLDRRIIRTVPVLRAAIVRLVNDQPGWSRSDTRMDNWIEEQIRLLAMRGWGIKELTADDRVPDVFSRWVSDIYEHTFLTPESVPEWLTPEDVEPEKQKRALAGAFRQVVEAEREVLLIRMQIERETLYDAYDRLTSEAELRFSICPPLALLSVIAAVLWSPWCLVALVMPAILAVQASRLYASAQERVLQVLTTGLVQSPTVQQLHELESVKRF